MLAVRSMFFDEFGPLFISQTVKYINVDLPLWESSELRVDASPGRAFKVLLFFFCVIIMCVLWHENYSSKTCQSMSTPIVFR